MVTVSAGTVLFAPDPLGSELTETGRKVDFVEKAAVSVAVDPFELRDQSL